MSASTKTLLIFLSLLCSVVLLSIIMINAEEMKEAVHGVNVETGFSFRKTLAYIAYYFTKLIGFLFGID